MLRSVKAVTIFLRDLQAATKWYSNFLGTDPVRVDPESVLFELEGVDLCLHHEERDELMGRGGVVAYWHVDDIELAKKRVVDTGGEIFRPGIEIPERGRIC